MTGVGVNFREDTVFQGYANNILCQRCNDIGLVFCKICNKSLCEKCAINH